MVRIVPRYVIIVRTTFPVIHNLVDVTAKDVLYLDFKCLIAKVRKYTKKKFAKVYTLFLLCLNVFSYCNWHLKKNSHVCPSLTNFHVDSDFCKDI